VDKTPSIMVILDKDITADEKKRVAELIRQIKGVASVQTGKATTYTKI
jgi:cell division protein FtsX